MLQCLSLVNINNNNNKREQGTATSRVGGLISIRYMYKDINKYIFPFLCKQIHIHIRCCRCCIERNCVSLRICGGINKSKDAMIRLQLKAETDIMRSEGGSGQHEVNTTLLYVAFVLLNC